MKNKRGFVSIGLKNPKFNVNVGGVMRACGCYSSDLIIIEGERYSHSKADTQKVYKHIPVMHVDDLVKSKPFKSKIVAVELSDKASDLRFFNHPESAYYIFGPEDGSLTEEDINRADYRVFVPTSFCMNLAATVNVVLYDRMLKRTK